jgi:hypothetical protein
VCKQFSYLTVNTLASRIWILGEPARRCGKSLPRLTVRSRVANLAKEILHPTMIVPRSAFRIEQFALREHKEQIEYTMKKIAHLASFLCAILLLTHAPLH